MDYLKNTLKTYANSFKNKKIPLVLAINILFVLIASALIKLTKIISQSQIDKINSIDLSDIISQTEAQLQATISTLRGFALFAMLTAVLFLLLLIISWTLCQGIIYTALLKKKFSLRHFEKFLILNLIWIIPWLILIFMILFVGKTENFIAPILILALLFLHFSLILYTLFAKNNKLGQIKQALKLGITKIHHFIMPYLIIIITFIILSQLNLLNINYLIIAFVYLLFFSWLQNYTKEVIISLG